MPIERKFVLINLHQKKKNRHLYEYNYAVRKHIIQQIFSWLYQDYELGC